MRDYTRLYESLLERSVNYSESSLDCQKYKRKFTAFPSVISSVRIPIILFISYKVVSGIEFFKVT